MCDRIFRTSLDAIAAKDAAAVIDVVNLRVSLIDADALLLRTRIVRGFNVNAFRWTSRGAQKTGNAFLAAQFVDMKKVLASITWLDRHRLIGILNGLLSFGNVR